MPSQVHVLGSYQSDFARTVPREGGEPLHDLLPHLRTAVTDAYGRAGISGPAQLDAVETHDCFTITEHVALDHLGLTPPRQVTGRAGATQVEGAHRVATLNIGGSAATVVSLVVCG
jgi:acetyl-CoA C-acetyltransferase